MYTSCQRENPYSRHRSYPALPGNSLRGLQPLPSVWGGKCLGRCGVLYSIHETMNEELTTTMARFSSEGTGQGWRKAVKAVHILKAVHALKVDQPGTPPTAYSLFTPCCSICSSSSPVLACSHHLFLSSLSRHRVFISHQTLTSENESGKQGETWGLYIFLGLSSVGLRGTS